MKPSEATTEETGQEEPADEKLSVTEVPSGPRRNPTPSGAKASLLSELNGKRVWMGIAAVEFAALIIVPVWIVSIMQQPVQVIAVDGANTFHIGPAVDFSSSSELRDSHALQATWALLTRSQVGFSLPEMQQGLFNKDARDLADKDLEGQIEDLKIKKMRVVPEVSKMETVTVQEDRVFMRVTGQMIHRGEAAGQLFEYPENFVLLLRFIRNPDLTKNAKYPLVVYDYELRKSPASAESEATRERVNALLKNNEPPQ